jgi:hypothetical protein
MSAATFYVHVERYAAATSHLTTTEHGAYLLLLMEAFNKGSIPNDARTLARIVSASPGVWRRVAPTVLAFFDAAPDRQSFVSNCDYAGARIADGRQLDIPMAQWRVLREEVLRRDEYRCRYCAAESASMECDHVHPLSLGGLSTPHNLVAACKPCNASKGARPLSVWGGRA